MILDTIFSLLVMGALQSNEMGVCWNPDVCLELELCLFALPS